jgi:putative flippase GtrA
MVARLLPLLRAGAAGIAATLVDLGVLALLVSALHWNARAASIPALFAGGVANFVGNRHFAFRSGDTPDTPGRAQRGSLARQAALYTIVELVALALNGVLYDFALRTVPVAAGAYWAVRLVTSHVVFLAWSYPLWRRVFVISVRASGRAVRGPSGA